MHSDAFNLIFKSMIFHISRTKIASNKFKIQSKSSPKIEKLYQSIRLSNYLYSITFQCGYNFFFQFYNIITEKLKK